MKLLMKRAVKAAVFTALTTLALTAFASAEGEIAIGAVCTTGTSLRMRSEPSTSASIVTTLQALRCSLLTNTLAAVAMMAVLLVLCVGVKYGIDIYTHHGEAIRVPDIRYKNIDDATHILDDAGLEIVVTDTGYFFTMLLIRSG